MPEHNHMCAWACGNVADNVIINLNTSEADILCTPCFLRLANDISEAWLAQIAQQAATEGGADNGASTSEQHDDAAGRASDAGDHAAGSDSGSGVGAADDPEEVGNEPPELDATIPDAADPEAAPGDAGFYDSAFCPDCSGTEQHEPGCVFG